MRAQTDNRLKELEEAYQQKFSALEQERSRQTQWLAQREEELQARHHRLERELRNQINSAKIEQQAAFDEKTRRLLEERTQLQKEYEQKLRELEQRRQRSE